MAPRVRSKAGRFYEVYKDYYFLGVTVERFIYWLHWFLSLYGECYESEENTEKNHEENGQKGHEEEFSEENPKEEHS